MADGRWHGVKERAIDALCHRPYAISACPLAIQCCRERLERPDAYRPLFTRFEQPCDQLLPIEPFAGAVLLHHHVRNLVDPLVAGEPLPAVEAFAPAPDDLPFLRFARVDDLVAQVRAVWTPHRTHNCKHSTLRP